MNLYCIVDKDEELLFIISAESYTDAKSLINSKNVSESYYNVNEVELIIEDINRDRGLIKTIEI
jgi:hypothetical protein